jgi:SAM-dependent methyltransferase
MKDSIPEPLIINSMGDGVYRGMAVVAGMQLDLFTPLRDGPLTADQIAASLGVGETRLRPLLYALVAVGLLTVDGGCFSNSAEADYYLVGGRPAYRGDRHKIETDLWIAALSIAESIRTGKPQAAHDYANMGEDELDDFLCGLHARAYNTGICLAREYDFSCCQTVVDVGGGTGGLAIALAEALPHLQVTVAELPSVVPVTRRFLERAGVTERVHVQGVDVVRQPLTGTFDAAVLRAFLQVLSLDDAYHALLNVKQALQPGGTIYIPDMPLDDSRLTPHGMVLFNPVMVAIYEDGQKLTVQEYRDLTAKAGFEDFALHAGGFMTARKPVRTGRRPRSEANSRFVRPRRS